LRGGFAPSLFNSPLQLINPLICPIKRAGEGPGVRYKMKNQMQTDSNYLLMRHMEKYNKIYFWLRGCLFAINQSGDFFSGELADLALFQVAQVKATDAHAL